MLMRELEGKGAVCKRKLENVVQMFDTSLLFILYFLICLCGLRATVTSNTW